ncbi:MAG: hypothetical protein GJ671_00600 [Alteromonadaceae bacterium]|nr:hypothetical protein [Alteromonadaceae bacterium]
MKLYVRLISYYFLLSIIITADAQNLDKGTYWKSFENSIVGHSGEKYLVHDFFDYKKNGTILTFYQFTNFYNGHSCRVSGEAVKADTNLFQMSYKDDKGKSCLFEIRFSDAGIISKLIVGGRNCMECTSRGSIYETTFQADSLNKSPHSHLRDLDLCLNIVKRIEKDGTITTYDGASDDILLEFENRNISLPTRSKLISDSLLK